MGAAQRLSELGILSQEDGEDGDAYRSLYISGAETSTATAILQTGKKGKDAIRAARALKKQRENEVSIKRLKLATRAFA